jgi:hypothetical protein
LKESCVYYYYFVQHVYPDISLINVLAAAIAMSAVSAVLDQYCATKAYIFGTETIDIDVTVSRTQSCGVASHCIDD